MIGKIISHYQILEKLGEGGMGVVYKARDLRLNRFVALKFLPPELTDFPDIAARFEREARAISALNHPNIATIHEMDQADGRRFLVLEYLPGGTLRARLRELRQTGRQLSFYQVARLSIQIADGLAHAHRAGVTHRDIKSDNVMFTAEGLARITDFGLAKSAHHAEITREGTTIGTAAYMSPEQAAGEEVDGRSDIFSLGIVMYEMIAGARPFLGQNEVAMLHAIIHDRPPSLEKYRSGVPPEMKRIVGRMLEKDRSKRYQRAEDVANDLKALEGQLDSEVSDVPVSHSLVPTATLVEPVTRRTYGRRSWVLGAALILLIAAAIWLAPWRSPTLPGRTGLPARKHIAVLPVTSDSADPDQEAFSNGLTDLVASKLTQLAKSQPGITVVPQSDIRRNNVTKAAEARRLFGATLAIAGRLQQVNGRARLNLDLIDTQTARILRQRSVEAAGNRLSTIREQAVKNIAAMLELPVETSSASSARASSAYDFYVQGDQLLQRYDQKGNVDSAIALFQKAIDLDPSYALAYAGLAQAYLRKWTLTHDAQHLEQARNGAEQAIARNQGLASPHITLAGIAVATGQLGAAIRQSTIAISLDPVNSDAYRELAGAYSAAGRLTEAEETYKTAIQLRPAYWLPFSDIAVFYHRNGRYQEAARNFAKAIELAPDNHLTYSHLGGLYIAMGKYAEAEDVLKKSISIEPSGAAYANLGTLYIHQGAYREAVPALEQAVQLGGESADSYVTWGNLGDAYRWTSDLAAKAPGAFHKAIEHASTQLAASPNNAVLLSQLAVYHAKLGQNTEALVLIEKARKLAPKDISVLFRSVVVYELAKERKQALGALKNALKNGYAADDVRQDPELKGLRTDPGYGKLMREKQ